MRVRKGFEYFSMLLDLSQITQRQAQLSMQWVKVLSRLAIDARMIVVTEITCTASTTKPWR